MTISKAADSETTSFLQRVRWRRQTGRPSQLVLEARAGDVAAFSEEFLARWRASQANDKRPSSDSIALRGSLDIWPQAVSSLSESVRDDVQRWFDLVSNLLHGKVAVVHGADVWRKLNSLAERLGACGAEDPPSPRWGEVRSEGARERSTAPHPQPLSPKGRGEQKLESPKFDPRLSIEPPRPTTQHSALLPSTHPDEHLLLSGELPWQAGLLFADVLGADRWQQAGAQFIRQQLLDCTDETGLPHAGLLDRLPQWLASMFRATLWGQACDVPLWTGSSRRRFEGLLKHVTDWRRDDGQLVWPVVAERSVSKASRTRDAFATNLPQVANTVGSGLGVVATAARSGNGRADKRSEVSIAASIRPVVQSDGAGWAWLRSDRSRRADSIVARHHGLLPELEFSAFGQQLFRGTWGLDVRFNSQPVVTTGRWECVCWNSDAQADYLELQLELDGLTIERQVMLSRTEHFALLADAVRFTNPGRIDFTSHLPLAAIVKSRPDRTTREVCLKATGLSVRVFPLALPQSRVIGTAGGLELTSSMNGNGEVATLALHQAAQGHGLFAPLLFDWSPKRSRVAADWRSLTVTEEMAIVRPDAAAGHRLRLGDKQLLIYHSLAKSAEARAVLGHQTRSETVIGWFTPSGDVQPIMVVE